MVVSLHLESPLVICCQRQLGLRNKDFNSSHASHLDTFRILGVYSVHITFIMDLFFVSRFPSLSRNQKVHDPGRTIHDSCQNIWWLGRTQQDLRGKVNYKCDVDRIKISLSVIKTPTCCSRCETRFAPCQLCLSFWTLKHWKEIHDRISASD